MKNSHIPTVRHPFMMAGDALLVVLIPIPDICVNSLYRAPPERNQGTEIFCLRHVALISSRFSTNESRIKKALLSFMVVSSPQCDEKYSFFLFFALAGSTVKAFCRLSLWSFKEKSISHFLGHSLHHPRVFPRRKGRPVPRSVFSSCSIRRNPAALRRTP